MKSCYMIFFLFVLAVLCARAAQSSSAYKAQAMPLERQTALYAIAFRYVYKHQRHRWPKVKNWVLAGIANRDAIAKQLRTAGYHVVAHEAEAAYYEVEHLTFDASDFRYQKQNRVLALVRLQHRGAYDHVHHTRGENFWTWATLQIKLEHGQWTVVGVEGKWEGED